MLQASIRPKLQRGIDPSFVQVLITMPAIGGQHFIQGQKAPARPVDAAAGNCGQLHTSGQSRNIAHCPKNGRFLKSYKRYPAHETLRNIPSNKRSNATLIFTG